MKKRRWKRRRRQRDRTSGGEGGVKIGESHVHHVPSRRRERKLCYERTLAVPRDNLCRVRGFPFEKSAELAFAHFVPSPHSLRRRFYPPFAPFSLILLSGTFQQLGSCFDEICIDRLSDRRNDRSSQRKRGSVSGPSWKLAKKVKRERSFNLLLRIYSVEHSLALFDTCFYGKAISRQRITKQHQSGS